MEKLCDVCKIAYVEMKYTLFVTGNPFGYRILYDEVI